MKRRLLAPLLALLLPAVAMAADLPLAAQSKSGAIRFYASPGTETVAGELASTADWDRTEISKDLGSDYDGTTDVYLAADEEEFQHLVPAGASVPGWATGVAFPDRNLIILRTSGEGSPPRAVLRHELSHISVGRLTHGQIPHWFLEGLAIVRAGNMWSKEGPSLIRAGLSNDFLSMDSLRSSFPVRPSDAELAYAESASFMQFLIDRNGESALQEVMRQVMHGATFDDALLRVEGASTRHLENAWRKSLDKWVLAIDFLSSRELLWMVLTLLTLFVGWRARTTRRALLRQREQEEQQESDQALLRSPAMWAEGPPQPEASQVPPLPPPSASDDDSSDPPDDEETDTTPRKPTIH